MFTGLFLAAGLASSAGCVGLEGRHADAVVVDRATPVAAGGAWTPEGAESSPRVASASFCRVEGHIEGNIGFELWLPQDWNGRLLGAGVGGDAGRFNYGDMNLRVREGFATVTTDSGHKASNPLWMADTKARIDYEHRAVHLTAVAAKALARRFYGRKVDRSYFTGCSGGGRQGMKEVQTYPQDYDGVLSGANGPTLTDQSARMLWASLEQQRRPDGALTADDWALYTRRVVAQCDSIDGLTDGIVSNPLQCRFDTAQLQCRNGRNGDCLSPAKAEMLTRIVSPFRTEDGRVVDRGLVPGVSTRPGPPSPLLFPLWRDTIHLGTVWDPLTFLPGKESQDLARFMPELDAGKTDLSAFFDRSGKAIIYYGWEDASLQAMSILDYYGRLIDTSGGLDALGQNVRLFMVPGMAHCRGGPGADSFGGSGHEHAPGNPENDMLWALVRWVEEGVAPDEIVASKFEGDEIRFRRKLCPFPMAAHYEGGPPNEATSFSCEVDPLLASWKPFS